MSRVKPTDRPEECESCGYETTAIKAYPNTRGLPQEETWKWLCNLCAGTVAGNAYEYPEQYDDASTLQTICYVGNAILDAINKRTVKP